MGVDVYMTKGQKLQQAVKQKEPAYKDYKKAVYELERYQNECKHEEKRELEDERSVHFDSNQYKPFVTEVSQCVECGKKFHHTREGRIV